MSKNVVKTQATIPTVTSFLFHSFNILITE